MKKACAISSRVRPDTKMAGELSEMLARALPTARPRAAFRVTTVDSMGDAHVLIMGVRFDSTVLRVNLTDAQIVYPFVATCGAELEEWSRSITGTLHAFWADTIMLLALGSAMTALETHLKDKVGPAQLSCMNPGSLEDWPLSQQQPLFDLLGSVSETLGVRLSSHMLLYPLKSVTGIQYVGGEHFVNCSLCPRQNCPTRRADYDRSLYGKKYLSLRNTRGKTEQQNSSVHSIKPLDLEPEITGLLLSGYRCSLIAKIFLPQLIKHDLAELQGNRIHDLLPVLHIRHTLFPTLVAYLFEHIPACQGTLVHPKGLTYGP
ncbi:MAG: hypothetical protein M0C28_08135 [Candidatus Moduliflexus flocculans]|nr:hypothetical protein [Candidatus Moduliflexus flocculans]